MPRAPVLPIPAAAGIAGTEDRLAQARPRLRIDFGADARLGPGKVELLVAIGETGSISAAGRRLGMSYRRAWLMVDQVNHLFREPVVMAVAGGSQGGGARLTPLGETLIAAYRRIEAATTAAIRQEFQPLAPLLAMPGDGEGAGNPPGAA